jgi:hypothetical protein
VLDGRLGERGEWKIKRDLVLCKLKFISTFKKQQIHDIITPWLQQTQLLSTLAGHIKLSLVLVNKKWQFRRFLLDLPKAKGSFQKIQ